MEWGEEHSWPRRKHSFSTRVFSGTKFGPSKPNRLGVNGGSSKFRDPGPCPLEMERGWPPRNTPFHSILCGRSGLNGTRIYRHRSEKKQLSLSFRLSKSLNVIGTETDRSATYDLLTVVMHSNRVPISYRFRAERCKIGPWLLCNVNRKSQMAERSVSVPMTLSDFERRNETDNFFPTDVCESSCNLT